MNKSESSKQLLDTDTQMILIFVFLIVIILLWSYSIFCRWSLKRPILTAVEVPTEYELPRVQKYSDSI